MFAVRNNICLYFITYYFLYNLQQTIVPMNTPNKLPSIVSKHGFIDRLYVQTPILSLYDLWQLMSAGDFS